MVSNDAHDESAARTAEPFAPTHWSVVLRARDEGRTESVAALEALCSTYWYRIYARVRRRGYGPEDAEDLTQAFLARLVSTHGLNAVHPAKGRFRWF